MGQTLEHTLTPESVVCGGSSAKAEPGLPSLGEAMFRHTELILVLASLPPAIFLLVFVNFWQISCTQKVSIFDFSGLRVGNRSNFPFWNCKYKILFLF